MPTDQADARGITINDMINDICYLIGLDDTAKLQVKRTIQRTFVYKVNDEYE